MVRLHLVSYDKNRSVGKVLKAIREAPKQEMNTPESMSGKVMEMRIDGRGPVGSLSEYHNHFGITDAILVVPDNKGVYVKMDKNGNWDAVETLDSIPIKIDDIVVPSVVDVYPR